MLPYLEVSKDEEEATYVKVPDLQGKTIKEAEKILKEKNLEIKLEESETDKNKTITRQIPEKDIEVKEGSKVIIHTD